eukprot:951764-Pyramimonas_sp.AAC.1
MFLRAWPFVGAFPPPPGPETGMGGGWGPRATREVCRMGRGRPSPFIWLPPHTHREILAAMLVLLLLLPRNL